ncbi:MAG: hypothetical protein IPH39_18930 [Sulfuritalea sp.]|nr:hypothetical protein [Sulfuritalea sp.]
MLASHAGHASHALLTSHAGHASHAGLRVGGLRRFSGGLGRFDLGRLGGLRGLLLAAGGEGNGQEGGYEERVLHGKSFIDRGVAGYDKNCCRARPDNPKLYRFCCGYQSGYRQ